MKKSSFSEDRLKITIEGFNQNMALNIIHSNKIKVRGIRRVNETTLVCQIQDSQLPKLKKALGLRYKITVIHRKGLKNLLRTVARHKMALWGAGIFTVLVIIQNLFIVDIEIRGNETIDENHLRQVLENKGLKEGALIYQDYSKLEEEIEEVFSQIVWLRIRHEGRYVLVDMAEGINQDPENLVRTIDEDKPCDIVSDKAGYIYQARPYSGYLVKHEGDYVKKGQVIISGKVPMQSYAYGTSAENQTHFYTHSEGEILAKIPRNLVYLTERYNIKKIKTGEKKSGIRICFFNKNVDFSQGKSRYKYSITKEKSLINIKVPFRFSVAWKTNEEVSIKKIQRNEEVIRKEALQFLEKWGKENQGQNIQIANKSLNFTHKKTIIKVSIVFNTIEKIGKERELVFGDTDEDTDN